MFNTFFKKINKNPNRLRVGAFISIPKCASKSVLKILDLGPNRDIEKTNSPVIYENHQRGVVLSSKYDLSQLFVFCFARNPYDRCISWFEFHKNLEPYKSLTFDSWIKEGLPHHFTVQNETDYRKENISPLLQYNYIENCKVDFIGRMETFEKDTRFIIEKLNHSCKTKELNWRFRYSDLKINQSQRKNSIDSYYTIESKDIVYSTLYKDFQYFQYKK